MIDPAVFLREVIDPGLHLPVMPPAMASDEARVLLLAIALQESGLEWRRQVDAAGNPISTLARGWWQFEKDGGVLGVCRHDASTSTAEAVCGILRVPFTVVDEDGDEELALADLHEAIAWNDPLAAAFARLLLWTDPAPLPELYNDVVAWEYYLRNWRPGKPHPETWLGNYALAVNTVMATEEQTMMAQPDKPEKEHPVHEDHPGKGRGENPNPGNKPDQPGQGEPTPHPEHPIVLPEEDDEPHPEQLPS